MHFEHVTAPVLPYKLWRQRVVKSFGAAMLLIGFSLAIGIIGYHVFGHLLWVDSILEASMILGGMGSVATMTNDAVKLFASAYALFSGLILVTTTAIFLAPWIHRMLHQFHAEADNKAHKTKF